MGGEKLFVVIADPMYSHFRVAVSLLRIKAARFRSDLYSPGELLCEQRRNDDCTHRFSGALRFAGKNRMPLRRQPPAVSFTAPTYIREIRGTDAVSLSRRRADDLLDVPSSDSLYAFCTLYSFRSAGAGRTAVAPTDVLSQPVPSCAASAERSSPPSAQLRTASDPQLLSCNVSVFDASGKILHRDTVSRFGHLYLLSERYGSGCR